MQRLQVPSRFALAKRNTQQRHTNYQRKNLLSGFFCLFVFFVVLFCDLFEMKPEMLVVLSFLGVSGDRFSPQTSGLLELVQTVKRQQESLTEAGAPTESQPT